MFKKKYQDLQSDNNMIAFKNYYFDGINTEIKDVITENVYAIRNTDIVKFRMGSNHTYGHIWFSFMLKVLRNMLKMYRCLLF